MSYYDTCKVIARAPKDIARTARTIRNYVARGGNVFTMRGRDLTIRYDNAARVLKNHDPEQWHRYCSANGFDWKHDGRDLFA